MCPIVETRIINPANPAAPTRAELEAGRDISCYIVSDGVDMAPQFDTQSLCDGDNPVTIERFIAGLVPFASPRTRRRYRRMAARLVNRGQGQPSVRGLIHNGRKP